MQASTSTRLLFEVLGNLEMLTSRVSAHVGIYTYPESVREGILTLATHPGIVIAYP